MDRFQLPTHSTPYSLDCNACNCTMSYSEVDAELLAEYGHCEACHLAAIARDNEESAIERDAREFGLTVEQVTAAYAITNEEQAAWRATDRVRNPDFYAELDAIDARFDEQQLRLDPAFEVVCDERLERAI